MRAALIWVALAAAMGAPLVVAATSPLIAWRDPVYIAACLAGAAAMAILLLQPLLAGGYLPRLPKRPGRRLHAVVGAGLVVAVLVHVAGLWATSPPDVIDVLLFRSPTPFAIWGALSMWAVFAAALLAVFRRRVRLAPGLWRLAHAAAASVVVVGAVVHAMLVEGMMGAASKAALCALALAATTKVMVDLRPWAALRPGR
ncbi:MAG: ferric reductase-like transmembrane domain-containing protein [Rubrimonas sp.]